MVDRIYRGADVVIASRYRKGSGTEGLSFYRHCLSVGASIFMMILHPIRGVRNSLIRKPLGLDPGFLGLKMEILKSKDTIFA